MTNAVAMDREYQLMNENAKRALQQCSIELCECMQTIELLVWMDSKNIFTLADVQSIEVKFLTNHID